MLHVLKAVGVLSLDADGKTPNLTTPNLRNARAKPTYTPVLGSTKHICRNLLILALTGLT